MDELRLDQLLQMTTDREALERAKILPLAPPGPYTAKCDEANWLEDDDDRFPGRLLLRCCFWAQTSNGKQARVSFRLSPQVWCKDPFNKNSVKLTDENRASLEGWPLDLTSYRMNQAIEALKEMQAPGNIGFAEAMLKYPLTFRVGVFDRDGGPANFVERIFIKQEA